MINVRWRIGNSNVEALEIGGSRTSRLPGIPNSTRPGP